jgi:hypothetical protein|tara:strand:- start:124 stop:759 length:636 start_codon:yes stop_codon:yes gene_type:complete
VAISKANFNSFNVTPTASKFITFNSSNNGLAADDVGGSLNLLSTVTISSGTSSVDFTSGIDSTYKEYRFSYINVHGPNEGLQVGFRDGGSNFDAVKTTTFFKASHAENDSDTDLSYRVNADIAQGTGLQSLGSTPGTDNDQSITGYLHLFDPSNTTFVKNFVSECTTNADAGTLQHTFVAGYCNTTTAIDGVQFKFNSNIDSGIFKMYGVT